MVGELRLLLIRHGETEWNREKRYLGSTDIGLNDSGLRQAAALANYLEDEGVDVIYTSPLQRASWTAQKIAKPHGLDPLVDDRLSELSFGFFEGLTFAEAEGQYPDLFSAWLGDYDQSPPDGESLADLGQRIADFLEALKRRKRPDNVVVVAHGGVVREMLRQLLGMPSEAHWYFSVSPASLSEIILYPAGPLVKRLNFIVSF
jgi:alpha-ribazole phosphatase